MMRLITEFSDDEERRRYEATVNDLKRRYSSPRQPRVEALGWPLPVPANRRSGQLTGSEYELVEMACTMSGRLAIANTTSRSGGLPDWEDTCSLPVIAPPDLVTAAEHDPPQAVEHSVVGALIVLGVVSWVFILVTLAHWGGL